MKKLCRLLIVSVLACGIVFAVAGCGNGSDDFVPPEQTGGVVSIDDAYDWNEDHTASTRPDLGGDYEPTLPPTDSLLTISEESDIRFAGGQTTFKLPIGTMLRQSDFDASTLGGRTVGGVGVYGKDNAQITAFTPLSEFSPSSPTTIAPYFAAEHGTMYPFGDNAVGDYYYDAAGNELDNAKPITAVNAIVDGFPGKKVSVAETLEAGSYFRSVTVCERVNGYSYDYYYRFVNYGETEISFTVYQMSTGHAWANESQATASEPITLAPGESLGAVRINVTSDTSNANTLTLIKLDKDVTGMSLGISMEVKDVTVREPATIMLRLPDKFTVSGYQTSVMTTDTLKLPTAEQITNETGWGDHAGWYDCSTGAYVTESTRITGDMTIAPYWQNVSGYNYVEIGSGANSGYNTDEVPGDLMAHVGTSFSYAGKWQSGNIRCAVNDPDGHNVSGVTVSDSAFVRAGSAIRFDSAHPQSVTTTTVIEYVYTVANYSSENSLKLSVYQISASSEYKSSGGFYGYESRYRVDVDLAPGESMSATAQYLLGSNGNALTYIVVEEDVSSLSFGFAASSKIVDGAADVADEYKNQASSRVTKKLDYNPADYGGLTVSEEYLVQTVGRLMVAPTAEQYGSVPAGKTIEKWQVVVGGTAYDLPASRAYTNPLMPSSGARLVPVLVDNTVTISLDAPDGFTVGGYPKTVDRGGKLVLPADGEITNDTGRTLAGWYNADTNTQVTADTVVSDNMTLAPYFAPENASVLNPSVSAGTDGTTIPDYVGTYDEARETFTEWEEDDVFEDTYEYYADYTKGRRISSSAAFNKNDAFRFKTTPAQTLDGQKTYSIGFTFKNLSDSAVDFDVYQINSGQDIQSETTSVKVGTVTLNGGGSTTLSANISYKNGNMLTMIVFNDIADGFDLFVGMTQTLVNA